jgi:hypothetical protein
MTELRASRTVGSPPLGGPDGTGAFEGGWPRERIAAVTLGVLAGVAGALALTTLLLVDQPGWTWIMRHQHPWPVIAIGLGWLVLGAAAIAASRRVVLASVALLVAAIAAAVVLGLEVDPSNSAYAFSDFRWWYLRSPATLAPLIGSAFVLAGGAGTLIGRERRRHPTGPWSVVAATLVWLLAALVAALAAVTGGMSMSMETELLTTHVALVEIGVPLWAVAGWATGRLGRRSPR